MTTNASQRSEPTLTNSPTKLCRICWNTHRWRRPTGEAALLEINSSVAEHGFGHEEWLFNFGYLIDGKHYAFLQPVGKAYAKLQDQKVNLILYAVPPPPARPVIVARIDGCEVITPSEAQKVWAIYKRRGWLREMSDQVEDLGYKREFESVKPTNLSNVRFSRAQVKFYDPYVPVPGERKAKSLRRYQLYPLGPESSRSLESKLEPAFGDHKRKSESARTQAACEGTVYDPVHDRIQNRLDKLLRLRFGPAAVSYESRHVDLTLRYSSGTRHEVVFFDVKTEPTVKLCIRAAVGQLLEYSYYPSEERATNLIVVGWALSEPEDAQYLHHLSEKFALPLGYWRFDAEARIVTERIGLAGPNM